MTGSEAVEGEIKQFIISSLRLEDVSADDIDSDAPLFGGGLGLDSVDALELGVALHKTYGIKIDSKSAESRAHLRSVRALAALVRERRQ
jgi:acyl carrier protein